MSGPQNCRAAIHDAIVEETFGDRQAFKGQIENFATPLSRMVNSID